MFSLKTIRNGSAGPEVRLMQRLLLSICYIGKNGKPLDLDGQFGANSEYALRKFQDEAGLEVDGICGPMTWKRLLGV